MRNPIGSIWQRSLATFLEFVSRYVGSDFDETDRDTVALGLEATDDEDSDGWYAYPLTGSTASLEVRLANTASSEVLSVVAAGAWPCELRLRIGTLTSAIALTISDTDFYPEEQRRPSRPQWGEKADVMCAPGTRPAVSTAVPGTESAGGLVGQYWVVRVTPE
ncbi:hypothetical protein ACH41H_49665 [Streptomyces sp. NPDC020800]|uniref:hypothetical protein n=1 Tax=Streptomyces sp. NPDC020800 TaxID=3365092 RepID=UPI0037BA62C0